MKFSEAMLKGFQMVDGKQIKGSYFKFDGRDVIGCCAMGAVSLGSNRRLSRVDFDRNFQCAWGLPSDVINDEGMPWEHIYGMAVAAGL